MKRSKEPDYRRIYTDIISLKYPLKFKICGKILSKHSLSKIDVIALDKLIFGEVSENQKYRSYDKKTILKILDYQKKNNLNNVQLALHFKLSRNTVTKWKKLYF